MPVDPCDDGSGGGGRGGFGGGGNAGPHVVPGNYTVALMAGNRTLDTKPIRIVMDPAVRLAGSDRTRWNAITAELHSTQRRGNEVQNTLNTLHPQMTEIAGKIAGMSDVPANVKSQFDALNTAYEAVRVKFGVPVAAAGGGGRGGGGFGRGGGAGDNALARVAVAKGQIMNVWEAPSSAVQRQAAAARTALNEAVNEANGVVSRARALAPTLRRYNLTLNIQ
jgi:hypothetical protein